jgi:transmembrane protein TMEM260 (protein O-mannosyltransferase)
MTSRPDAPGPAPAELTRARTTAAVCAAIAFVVYLRTVLPGVSVGDWAEMQFIPAQLGVPHPTGYPLYVLLGKLFSLVPVGSVAFRAVLLSAVAAAATVAVAVLIASRLGVRPVISAAAGLALAFSGTLWLEATFSEMNGLHLLLVGLVLHQALAWRAERRDRDLLFGALLAGLALSNHLLAATTVPIVILFVLWDARRRLRERPALLFQAGLVLALGLTPYLFIPLRALAGPPAVYASLATAEGFVNLVTGADFRGNMHFFSLESLAAAWRDLPVIVAHVLKRSSPILLIGGIAGLGLLARRDFWLAVLLGLLAISGVYFLANYVADLYHYLLVGWLVLAIGVAVAGEWLVGRLEAGLGPRAGIAQVLLLLLPLSILVQQWPLNDQSGNRVGERLSEQVFSLLPPNAILLTYWDTLTTLSYKHCMEGVRPDVTLRTYDLASRVTCDRVVDPLEEEVRRGRPAFALFARPGDYEPLRRSFDLLQGETLDLPYGQRYLDYRGPLVRLELKEAGGG